MERKRKGKMKEMRDVPGNQNVDVWKDEKRSFHALCSQVYCEPRDMWVTGDEQVKSREKKENIAHDYPNTT
jgi:hypothetical protein